MKKTTLIALIVGIVIGVIAWRWLGTLISAKVEHRVAQVGLTENEKAANGPLPGDVSLYEKELATQQKIPTAGYYSSLNGAEISDAQRSGMFPAATFTGSFDGPNKVFAWASEDTYQGISYINNRKPGELYIVGGEYPTKADPIPAGPFVAKADATTGKEIWRTYLDNPNASKRWIGNANLNILDNGKIAFAWDNRIVLLDADTGQILKHNTLPTGDCPVEDANYKHLTIAPDRTLIMKDQTRPIGETAQGTMAILQGIAKGLPWPNSHLCAVDPDTLQILHDIPLPEPCVSPHIIAELEGKIVIYVPMKSGVMRCFWDPVVKKLSVDDTWVVKSENTNNSTAPTLVGEWVAIQTNGGGSDKIASSIFIAHRKDSKNTHVIFPFGPLKPGQWSFCPPKPGADPENNMIYSADMGIGKVAGIKLDPATGEMKVAFVLEDMTTTFQPVIGPKGKRVLLLTNMKKNVPSEPNKLALFAEDYKEQLTWHDAGTGRLLAESDFFEPLTINSLTPPGFGGRVYFPTAVGKRFFTLQVMPATAEDKKN